MCLYTSPYIRIYKHMSTFSDYFVPLSLLHHSFLIKKTCFPKRRI